MEYALGQRVTISATLTKDHDHEKRRTMWRRDEKNTAGIIVGKRTLSEGVTHSGYKEDGPDSYDWEPPVYIADKVFTVWLVAFNMRNNPVYVLPEDIKNEEVG